MKETHYHRTAGLGMIMVAGSLAAIAIIGLFIGEDVLFADRIQRADTAHYVACSESDFVADDCQKYMIYVQYEKCVAEQDLESPECHRYTTWVESAIFEECRANRDVSSPQCQKYVDIYEGT